MLARLLTIVGAGREGWVVLRRGREKTVCARGASRTLLGGHSTSPLGDAKGHHVDLRSVVLLGLVVSLVLSSVLSVVILPPTRALLRRLCPLEDTVAFWTRFTVLMLFLGPLLVTLIFGVPYSELSSKLTATDLVVRVISAALVGSFLTLGGIGLRIGTLRQPVGGSLPPPKRTDDERIR